MIEVEARGGQTTRYPCRRESAERGSRLKGRGLERGVSVCLGSRLGEGRLTESLVKTDGFQRNFKTLFPRWISISFLKTEYRNLCFLRIWCAKFTREISLPNGPRGCVFVWRGVLV